MSEPNRSVFARVERACLWAASVLWVACAGSSPHSRQGQWRLDTETAGRLRHATTVAGEGASTAAPAAAPTMASVLVKTAPLLVTVLGSDNAVGELEERLWECAREAERRINARYFGGRAPTRAECGEEVVVDGCPQPITRAMQLGQQKHALALECAREVLQELWPRPFRLEQRYRYYRNAQFLEMVSREEEARLIAQGCTRELWRTLKPDIVLYTDDNWRRAAFILDLKFPCPPSNESRWREYGGDSAYEGSNQKQIYGEALGTEPMMLSPRKGFSR